MRRAVLAGALTSGLVLCAMRPAMAQGFAGTVHYTIHDENGKTMTMTQVSKPGHYAIQITNAGNEGKTGGFIVDSAAGTMTMVDGDNKTYIVITKEMMQMASMMGRRLMDSSRADSHAPKATITRAGSSVVAGISCDVFHYDAINDDNKHVTGDVCLAKGVGMGLLNLNPMGGMMGGTGMQRQREGPLQDRLRQMGEVGDMLSHGYGILKATSIEDGQPRGSIEVTAIERGTPPDAAFAPPSGYTEKTMGNMMGGGRRP